MNNLSQLEKSRNIYYAGLDDNPFPKPCRKRAISLQEHIRYIKILALLADHIAIPPTFLVSAINTQKKSEDFKLHLIEFFKNDVVLTAVYNSMSEAKDFIDYKIQSGSNEERIIFKNNELIAVDLFSQITTWQRDIRRMSGGFKNRLISNLESLIPQRLSDQTKDRLIMEINQSEQKGDLILSQDSFQNILFKLHIIGKEYESCFYAMKDAYYSEGAFTYYGTISLPSVENYFNLGHSIFSRDNTGISLAYDPELFRRFLYLHNIGNKDIDQLNMEGILFIRNSWEFETFKNFYFEFCQLIQKAEFLSKKLSKKEILFIKSKIIDNLQQTLDYEGTLYSSKLEKILNESLINQSLGSFFLAFLSILLIQSGGISLAPTLLSLKAPLKNVLLSKPWNQFLEKIPKSGYVIYHYLNLLKQQMIFLDDITIF